MKANQPKPASTATNTAAPFFQPEASREGFFGSEQSPELFFQPATALENTIKPIQPKLTIGQPNDKYEQEADAMADQVVQRFSQNDTVQTKCDECEEEQEQNEQIAPKEDNLRRKPIFESEAEPALQAKLTPSATTIQNEEVAPQEMEEDQKPIQAKPAIGQTGSSIPLQIQMTAKPRCRDGRLTREQFMQGLEWLAENEHITSEEAEIFREREIPDSRRARCRIINGLAEGAERGRDIIRRPAQSGRRAPRLMTDFRVTPREIRVDEGESARISFNVTGSDITSVSCFILKYRSEDPTSRFFTFGATSGHKNAIWDGTFTGGRNQPAEPGVYRVNVWVSDGAGNREEAFEQIRVINDSDSTVLPRTQSGLALRSLNFNGHEAVLTDEGGNAIRARAVSGLRPNNPHNPRHRDYTTPEHECERNRGPLPHGTYFIDANVVQEPVLRDRKLRYPSGAGVSGWGPFRVPLRPASVAAVCGRSEFFFHLDVGNDGTAGCIGIPRDEEAKFNQMIALMMRIPRGRNLTVNVNY